MIVTGMRWDFDLYFLMLSDMKPLFMYLLAIWENVCLDLVPIFKLGRVFIIKLCEILIYFRY